MYRLRFSANYHYPRNQPTADGIVDWILRKLNDVTVELTHKRGVKLVGRRQTLSWGRKSQLINANDHGCICIKKKMYPATLAVEKEAVVYYSGGDYNNTGEGVMRF
jgi:hypothetical protein